MQNVLQKIDYIETIDVIKIPSLTQIWFSAKFYHYKAGHPEKLELTTTSPLEFDSLEEVRGFLKGFESLLGIELFVSKIGPLVLNLDAWTKVCRDRIKICHLNRQALTPRNLPLDIFEIKPDLEFLGSNFP